jgi:hypothetical protein
MKRTIIMVLAVFLIFITACNRSPLSTINPEVLVTPTPPPLPEVGKATIIGQIIHEEGYPMASTIIRLAEVARGAEGRGGAFILDVARSPGTLTDKNGYFIIPNVKAGEYVIVVGDVETTGIYQIISEANGTARIWNLPADMVTDVGVIKVNIVIPTPNPTQISGQYPAPTSYPSP